MDRERANFILRMVKQYPESTGYSEAMVNKALEATGDLKPTYTRKTATKPVKKSPMRWQRDALSFEGV